MTAIIEMRPAAKRWAWFVGLWAAGVATVWLVAMILRAWIAP